MTNFGELLYAQSMRVFGTPATLTPYDSLPLEVTAIDRTAGVEVEDQTIGIKTLRPAADVRRGDLDAAQVTMKDLDGGTIVINGTSWEISSVMEKPTPFGSADGLVTLLLVGNA